MIPAVAVRRISSVILSLFSLTHFGQAQTATLPAAEKVAPKVTYLLVGLDKEYTATAPSEAWEDFYASRLLAHFK